MNGRIARAAPGHSVVGCRMTKRAKPARSPYDTPTRPRICSGRSSRVEAPKSYTVAGDASPLQLPSPSDSLVRTAERIPPATRHTSPGATRRRRTTSAALVWSADRSHRCSGPLCCRAGVDRTAGCTAGDAAGTPGDPRAAGAATAVRMRLRCCAARRSEASIAAVLLAHRTPRPLELGMRRVVLSGGAFRT